MLDDISEKDPEAYKQLVQSNIRMAKSNLAEAIKEQQ
jgi:hypothetical protein